MAAVRFFCEWCFERVDIGADRSPYDEVLRHFTTCPRRPDNATNEQVAGLATHITGMITSAGEGESEKENGNVA